MLNFVQLLNQILIIVFFIKKNVNITNYANEVHKAQIS